MAINNIKPFKFWCQKVLPLVYDNSLSYYEVLCKVGNKLNEIIEVDNQQNEAIAKNADDIEILQHNVEAIQFDLQDLSQTVQNHTLELEELGLTINIIANNFAEEYSSLSTYDIGDVVMDGNHLYVKTANTGDFADDWTQTTVAEITKAIEGKISAINDRIGALVSSIESVASEIVAPYDTATSYTAGMYCSYLGDFYVCTDSTTGTFDRDKWDETNVGWELTDLRADYNVLSTLLNTVSGRVDTIRAIIAETYDEEMTYNEGDYCTDLGHLYKCNANNVTGVFDPTKWSVTTVGAELIIAMNSGGGGGGESVPAYDPTYDYAMYELMRRNDTTYMCISHNATIGSFVPSEWFEIPVKDVLRWSVFNAIGFNGLFDPNNSYPYGKLYGELFTDTDGRQCVSVQKVIDDWDGQGTPTSDATSLVEIMNESLSVMSNYNRDTYDPTKTYNNGDLIINYAGRCMRCNTDGTTGTFDILKWDDTNMFEELANIKNKMITLNLYQNEFHDSLYDNVTEVI